MSPEMSTDPFVPGPRCHVAGAASGPLAGLTFAVKDLIDVAATPTGGGNPDWPRFYPTPEKHAWVVQTLAGRGRLGDRQDRHRRGVSGDIGGERA